MHNLTEHGADVHPYWTPHRSTTAHSFTVAATLVALTKRTSGGSAMLSRLYTKLL